MLHPRLIQINVFVGAENILNYFLRDAMQARALAFMRCLSVRPFDIFMDFAETNKHIFDLFYRRVATPF